MKCEVCSASGPNTTLIRQNKAGEMPAIWRCVECNVKEIDNDLQDLIDSLRGWKG